MKVSSQRVRAFKSANRGIGDFAQTVVINGQVDVVIVSSQPVVFVVVPDDEAVVSHFSHYVAYEVFGTS